MTTEAHADLALAADLDGPPRRLRLALGSRAAAYLATAPDSGRPTATVCALVDHHGVAVPDAIVLPPGLHWARLLDAHLTHGTPVLLGARHVRCGGVSLPVRASIDSRVEVDGPEPRTASRALRRLTAARARIAPVGADSAVDDPAADTETPWPALAHTWTGGLATPAALRADASRLVGRGPGLTPSGDDLCSGVLLVHRLLATPGTDVAAERLLDLARTRTTAASQLLLHAAAETRAAPPIRRLLAALFADDAGPAGVETRLAAVLALGHTSGSDLADGIRDGLAACVAARLAAPPPTVPSFRSPSSAPPTERNCA